MSGLEAFLAWSGWGLSVVGLVATVVSMRQASRERGRSERIGETLSRVYAESRAIAPTGTASERDQRARAHLIRTASSSQPLSVALARARRNGIVDEDVRRVAEELRQSGLLRFEPPLTDRTLLELNR